MAMRPQRIRLSFCLAGLLLIILCAAVILRQHTKILIVENQETGAVYARVPVRAGDELSFEWEHSFEHVPWHEYYVIVEDGGFILRTISVAGFGAGIPAEMDCEYRYEDGLIYMDNIESYFPKFNWINSQTALKRIDLNGQLLLRGSDMPHHEKIVLSVRENGSKFQRKYNNSAKRSRNGTE